MDNARQKVSLRGKYTILKKVVSVRGFSSVDEEDSGAGQAGESVSHLADSCVVDEPSEEEQQAWRGLKRG